MKEVLRRARLTGARRTEAIRQADLKRFTPVAIGIALGLGGLILIQLLYPSGRTLPFQRIGDTAIGFTSTTQARATLDQAEDRRINLRVADNTEKPLPRDLGLAVDTDATIRGLFDYPWYERLLPFSLVLPRTAGTVLDKHQPTYRAFVQRMITEHNRPPVEAAAEKKDDTSFQLKPGVKGLQLTPAQIDQAISDYDPFSKKELAVKPTTLTPSISEADLAKLVKSIEETRRDPPTVEYNGKTYRPDGELIGSWASITQASTPSGLQVRYDGDAIRKWISNTMPLAIQAATDTLIVEQDGVELSRTGGQTGRGIDLDDTVAQMQKALTERSAKVTAKIKQLTPKQQFDRRYSTTDAGLQAMLQDWKKDNPNIKAGVTVRELGGQKRQASLQANDLFESASMYKLYLTWYLYHGIEAGTISPDAQAAEGKTIKGCIEAMLVFSDNPCGEKLGNSIGWRKLQDFVKAGGLTHTDLSRSPLKSSATDSAAVFYRLADGTLLNPAHTAEFNGYLARQVYRAGIPAGLKGSSTSNKTGISDGVYNDAGIIRGPKSTYVLSVYSNGNAAAIKDLTARVENLLQR